MAASTRREAALPLPLTLPLTLPLPHVQGCQVPGSAWCL
jgi:hypothetical protein